MNSLAVLFLALFFCLIIGVPIAASIGIACFLYISISDVPYFVFAQQMIRGVDSMTLIALPGFIIAGKVMDTGGLAKRLVRFSELFVSRITGGLSMVTILTCMIFGAISGSNVATTAAIGGIMIPEMVKRNYPRDYSAAVAATGGILGAIIPPSIGLVLYGSITGVSIPKLFAAGIPVGIFMGLMVMALCYYYGKKNGYIGSETAFSKKDVFLICKDAILALFAPVIILGGILTGIFTPTEAAIVSIIYGFIVGIFVYKEIAIKDVPKILLDGGTLAAVIMFIVAFATVFGWVIAAEQVPQLAFGLINSISGNPFVILLMINLVLLTAGMFMESGALILIAAPILAPMAVMVGMDPVHFAIMFAMNIGIGCLTPPFGVVLFTGSIISGVTVEAIIRRIVPFIIVYILALIIVILVPGIPMMFIH